ncbi:MULTISPECIES: YczE/YyaS/YitT family protein [Sporosarcina]|uniref:YczE/YyaS/YitT family protein n=1 Tax=Sporosarcina TaxID=1569 RepID=UPI00129BC6A2|nr:MULTISPECIES: YitT family protein [Sporosarcina]GKV67366.1 putative membrane protein YczE [Sporosarcina sp. NCCP-2331]GLB57722.1 putative membrane protein YczE [Sporosarcina sp. NCCP-2378]
MRNLLAWRWIFFVGGMMIMSLGISLTIKGQRFGIGPWDVLHVGLFQNIGLTIGSWSILTGLLIVTVSSLALKEWPRWGTWLNMLVIGLFIDFFNWLLPDVTSVAAQSICFVLGVLVMAYGVGIYVSPNLGAGPRDSLMLLLVDKLGWSLRTARTTIEAIVTLVGFLLGGPVGIGTLFVVLFIGQFIQIAMPQCKKLLLWITNQDDEKVLLRYKRA